MYRRNRAGVLALLICASLSAGCVVEQPASSPEGARGAQAVGNSAAAGTGASTEAAQGPAPVAAPEVSRTSGGKLEAYARAAAAGLAPEQREALSRVEGEGRRLLALRGYLRAGGETGSRWAWSRERVESYEKSPEYAAALAEVEKVRREFETSNPGYTLRVNTKVRSLDEQLEKWNEADSVGRAGEELLAGARAELAGGSYGEGAAPADLARFGDFLRGFRTSVTPTVAVPGLSPHGQSRAFDFQVMQGPQTVAGASASAAAEVWDKAGWTERLREAVRRASTKFEGPLASPREPWHYEYRP